MNSILLVLASNRRSSEALHWAMHTAKQSKRKLQLVYLTDGQTEEDVKKTLDDLDRQCRTFQVDFESSRAQGDYTGACEKMARETKADVLVYVEPKRRFWERLTGKFEAGSLKDKISCELKVYVGS